MKRRPPTTVSRALTIVVCGCAALGVLTAGAGARQTQGTTPTLDHFKCYDVKPLTKVTQHAVVLTDQFRSDAVQVHKLDLHCNPVTKTFAGAVTAITQPDAHLECRSIKTAKHPRRLVQVKNQFGVQNVETGAAELLCLPASKSASPTEEPGPVPATLDHFKCYRAKSKQPQRQVTLIDQFLTETTVLFDVVLFCNPTAKRFGGSVTEIRNPQGHLTCYRLEPKPFQQRTVSDRTQFGVDVLRVTKPRMLCVPSEKLKVEVLPGKGDEPGEG